MSEDEAIAQIIENDRERNRHVCQACGAVGYGNATCRDCVAQWPRFGHPQSSVDSLLRALGNRPPEAPFGTTWH
jgi:hypothetical protein